MAREFGPGEWRYVNLSIGSTTLKYVFPSKLKDSLKSQFGQTDITSQFDVSKAVLSPNRPKPARAAKRFPDGYEGSFCSSDKIKSLKADGYTITRAKLATFNQTDLSRVLFVTINGVRVAWRRPRNAGGVVDVSPVGAQEATDEVDLVFGTEFPRPAQAVRVIPRQGTYRSFVDDTKVDGATLDAAAVSAGWSITSPQEINAASLINRTIG